MKAKHFPSFIVPVTLCKCFGSKFQNSFNVSLIKNGFNLIYFKKIKTVMQVRDKFLKHVKYVLYIFIKKYCYVKN